MKFLGKSFAVAAMALAVSTAAEARIQSVGDNTADGSELILNVVNYSKENSFTLDLGVTIAQFMANPSQSLSFSLAGSHFQSFVNAMAASDNVTWGVSGGHGKLETEEDLSIWGFYSTATSVPSSFDTNVADVNNTQGKWDGLVSNIQTQDSNANNLSAFRVAPDPAYTGNYGNDFQTALPFASQGSLSEQLVFVAEALDPALIAQGDYDTTRLVKFGDWKINLAQGSLQYAVSTSAVPVPAAVWMFGTGLLGLLGLNRRKAA